MSSKHDLRSTAKGSSGSHGPKKPGGGGPNNDVLTDDPNKKKKFIELVDLLQRYNSIEN